MGFASLYPSLYATGAAGAAETAGTAGAVNPADAADPADAAVRADGHTRAHRGRLLGWAHTLAGEVLQRPDLTAELHAAAHRAGLPDGLTRWEAWAHTALGDSTGVPVGADGSEFEAASTPLAEA